MFQEREVGEGKEGSIHRKTVTSDSTEKKLETWMVSTGIERPPLSGSQPSDSAAVRRITYITEEVRDQSHKLFRRGEKLFAASNKVASVKGVTVASRDREQRRNCQRNTKIPYKTTQGVHRLAPCPPGQALTGPHPDTDRLVRGQPPTLSFPGLECYPGGRQSPSPLSVPKSNVTSSACPPSPPSLWPTTIACPRFKGTFQGLQTVVSAFYSVFPLQNVNFTMPEGPRRSLLARDPRP